MTDWTKLGQLSVDLAQYKKIIDFCETYDGLQVDVTLTSRKGHNPQSFEVTLPAPRILRLVIEQLWAEQDAAFEVLKDIVKDVKR